MPNAPSHRRGWPAGGVGGKSEETAAAIGILGMKVLITAGARFMGSTVCRFQATMRFETYSAPPASPCFEAAFAIRLISLPSR